MQLRRLVSPSLLVRSRAPEFTAKALLADGSTIGTVSSRDFLGKYWLLFFYPLDFTFVCPTEILAFKERLGDFQRLGCEVVGASVDSVHAHAAWSRMARREGGLGGALGFPLLADVPRTVSQAYRVLLGEDEGVALRGLFIMDRESRIRHQTVNDLGIGRSIEEVLRTVRAIQHHDQHGEVCPAGWEPGAATIDPARPQDYFGKLE